MKQEEIQDQDFFFKDEWLIFPCLGDAKAMVNLNGGSLVVEGEGGKGGGRTAGHAVGRMVRDGEWWMRGMERISLGRGRLSSL